MLSTKAWKITFEDALPSACEVEIQGVRVPFLGLDALIASKETYRDQDAIDRLKLIGLRQSR